VIFTLHQGAIQDTTFIKGMGKVKSSFVTIVDIDKVFSAKMLTDVPPGASDKKNR